MACVGLRWDTRHGHLLRTVCEHMHARVGLGWGTWHGVWVGTGRVSWTNEDVGFFEGG
jgi:hypothetical protein